MPLKSVSPSPLEEKLDAVFTLLQPPALPSPSPKGETSHPPSPHPVPLPASHPGLMSHRTEQLPHGPSWILGHILS